MKQTLIIHPSDRSTDFLRPIYQSLDKYTVITEGTKKEVNKLIKEHNRIIMMGHGSSSGLFSVNKFDSIFVIDYNTVPLFEDRECIFIWCNADKFVNAYDLKGLYSGMFISEVSEAYAMGLHNVPQFIVDESNNSFAHHLGQEIKGTLKNAYNNVISKYNVLAEHNVVAQYNIQRLYLSE